MSDTTDPTVTFPTGGGGTLTIHVPNYTQAVTTAKAISSQLSSELTAGTITAYDYDGTTTFAPPVTNNEVVLTGTANFVVLGTSTSAVINDSTSPVFLNGGNDANVDVVSDGILTYDMNAGTGRIVADGAVENIISAATGGGNHTIFVGDGSNTIDAFSGNDTISGGIGSNNVTFGTGNSVFTSRGADNVSSYNPDDGTPGGTDVINASTNTNAITVDGGLNNLIIANGSGASCLTGDSGSDTVHAGAGGGDYQGGTAGKNLLVGGSGAVTLVGGGSGDLLVAGGKAGDLLQASSGNETLVGALSFGNDTLQGGSGADVLTGGFGKDLITAGTGNDTEISSFGANLFQFVDGSAGGKDVIYGFQLNSGNKIDLSGYGSNAVAQAVATQKHVGGSTVLTLSDHTQITLVDISKVTASNFG